MRVLDFMYSKNVFVYAKDRAFWRKKKGGGGGKDHIIWKR